MRSVMFVFAFLALTLFSLPHFVFADHDLTAEPHEEEKSATTAVAMTKVEYELAYPGILPDSPLYFLKAIRDRIVGSLVSDPLKKAEYLLLTSDKRFYAGIFLVDKNKDELALSTISKGNNYFEEAISKLTQAQKDKKDTNPMLNKMLTAGKKHIEVLTDLSSKVDSTYKEGYEKEKKRAEKMNTQLADLEPTSAIESVLEEENLTPTQTQ